MLHRLACPDRDAGLWIHGRRCTPEIKYRGPIDGTERVDAILERHQRFRRGRAEPAPFEETDHAEGDRQIASLGLEEGATEAHRAGLGSWAAGNKGGVEFGRLVRKCNQSS